jgi:hypothetical protein
LPGGGLDRGQARALAEAFEQRHHVRKPGALVQGQAHAQGIDRAQVDAPLEGPGVDRRGAFGARTDHQGVEARAGADREAGLGQQALQGVGQGAHLERDAGQALGPVVDPVEARHHRQQHLGGADVRGGLVSADVLLAGLHGHAQGPLAAAVLADPDDPAGQHALEFLARRQEGRVGAAIAQRHAEALGRAHGHVGPELAGSAQQAQGQEVRGHHQLGAASMHAFRQGLAVEQIAVGVGVLHQHARQRVGGEIELQGVADVHRQTQHRGARLDHVDRLRMAVFGHEPALAALVGQGQGHRERLGGGGALVEQRGVGQGQRAQVADHGLVVEQRFEAPLGDLGLVGGVLGVPARILEHVALDHARRVAGVVAHADVRAEGLVLAGQGVQVGQGLGFGARGGQVQGPAQADRGRHGLVDQGFEGAEPQAGELRGAVGRSGAGVARPEGVARAKVEGLFPDVTRSHGGSAAGGWRGGRIHRPDDAPGPRC